MEVVSCVRVVRSVTEAEAEAATGADEEGTALGEGEALGTAGASVTSVSVGSEASSSVSSLSFTPFEVWERAKKGVIVAERCYETVDKLAPFLILAYLRRAKASFSSHTWMLLKVVEIHWIQKSEENCFSVLRIPLGILPLLDSLVFIDT